MNGNLAPSSTELPILKAAKTTKAATALPSVQAAVVALSKNSVKVEKNKVERVFTHENTKVEHKKVPISTTPTSAQPAPQNLAKKEKKTQPDPLEHTRYGEGNHPSSNENPIPKHLVKPLTPTNQKDEHDINDIYNTPIPKRVYVPGMDILEKNKPKAAGAKPVEAHILAISKPAATTAPVTPPKTVTKAVNKPTAAPKAPIKQVTKPVATPAAAQGKPIVTPAHA